MLAYTAGDGLQAISRTYGIASLRSSDHLRERARPLGQTPQRNARPGVLYLAIRRLIGRG